MRDECPARLHAVRCASRPPRMTGSPPHVTTRMHVDEGSRDRPPMLPPWLGQAVGPVLVIVLVLALAVLMASWVPAWRAAAVRPTEALREA